MTPKTIGTRITGNIISKTLRIDEQHIKSFMNLKEAQPISEINSVEFERQNVKGDYWFLSKTGKKIHHCYYRREVAKSTCGNSFLAEHIEIDDFFYAGDICKNCLKIRYPDR